jgi:hypothetical protein
MERDMRRRGWLAGVVSLTASTAIAQSVPPGLDAWTGNYRYEWAGGHTAGGSAIVVTYDLRVSARSCRLDITGFQTDEHIICEIGADPSTLWVRFRSYADGKLTNRHNVARFRPGQELFRLRRDGNGAPLTEWQALAPDEARPPPAIRFRRV